jgi:hypothetical protein
MALLADPLELPSGVRRPHRIAKVALSQALVPRNGRVSFTPHRGAK